MFIAAWMYLDVSLSQMTEIKLSLNHYFPDVRLKIKSSRYVLCPPLIFFFFYLPPDTLRAEASTPPLSSNPNPETLVLRLTGSLPKLENKRKVIERKLNLKHLKRTKSVFVNIFISIAKKNIFISNNM